MDSALSTADLFSTLVHQRRSVRAFRPDPLPKSTIEHLLTLASQAPSNANTQPWRVEIVSGESRDRLSAALLEDAFANRLSPDIPYLTDQYPQQLLERRAAHLTLQQAAFGVERTDPTGRKGIIESNFTFFGAPHVAILLLPSFGNEREAADLGLFAQNFMLALTAHGLASCPQTALGLFSTPIRRQLGIGPDYKVLFAISFGYEDVGKPGARFEQGRAPLQEWVRFSD